MTKIKHIACKTWKPLKLEGAILSSGIEGLIGIEELSDYKLENQSKKTSKRKILQESLKDYNSVDLNLIKNSVKKLKVNQSNSTEKKKKKGKKTHLKNGDKEPKEETTNSNDTKDEGNFSSEAWSSLGVPPAIIEALRDQKFSVPTSIQALTLPPAILGRRDVLGAAETGSGKTLAFGIPILTGILGFKNQENQEFLHGKKQEKKMNDYTATSHGWIVSSDNEENQSDLENEEIEEDLIEEKTGCVKVINNIDLGDLNTQIPSEKPLYALILTPTRELAIQIKNHISKAAKYTDIKIAVVVGGMAAVKQERILSKGPEIVIATPGRLWELIDQGNLHLRQLHSLKYLAIDETDRMLEKGHFQELHQILERINCNEESVRQRQTFVFSATLTLVHDIPDYLQRKKKHNNKSKIFKLTPGQKLQKVVDLLRIKNPKIIDVTKERGTAGTLTECRITCTIDHKDYYLYYFLKRHQGRTLVFCNSIGCVKRLATLFGILDCNPLPLHASMQQRQRLKNLEKFQEDFNGLLIATDVAARGLDIPNIEHVIHYQVPRTSESYVHRSGRTARAQKEGITVLMMEPSELQYYTKLCKTLGRTEDIASFPVIDRLLIAVKERVNVAREIDKLELTCRRDNVQRGWLKKAAEDMDLVLDEEQVETTMELKESADLRRQLRGKKQQLVSLLVKPLFPKGFSGKYLETNMNVHLLQNDATAVEVMKKVIEEHPKAKRTKLNIITKKSSINKRHKRKHVVKEER